MLVLVGEFLGVQVRRVEPNRSKGQSFDAFDSVEATLLIERASGGAYTQQVTLAGRDIDTDDLPAKGDVVAFEVSHSVRAKGDRAYVTIKAWRRCPEVEALLAPARV